MSGWRRIRKCCELSFPSPLLTYTLDKVWQLQQFLSPNPTLVVNQDHNWKLPIEWDLRMNAIWECVQPGLGPGKQTQGMKGRGAEKWMNCMLLCEMQHLHSSLKTRFQNNAGKAVYLPGKHLVTCHLDWPELPKLPWWWCQYWIPRLMGRHVQYWSPQYLESRKEQHRWTPPQYNVVNETILKW